MSASPTLHARARALKLHGLLAHWEEVQEEPWLADLIDWEEQSRTQRSLERRLRQARLGAFKPLADFDWSWPKKIDRDQIDELFGFQWLNDATNGVGKTLLAKNLVHQAVLRGHTARFLTASELLNTLAEQDSPTALRRKIAYYTRPQLLAVD